MAAHRYWRLVGVSTYGRDGLEVGQILLFDAAGTLSGAVVTGSHAPTSGELSSIQDGLPPAVRFGASSVASSGFWLMWDFGSAPVDVVSLQVRAAQSKDRFPTAVTLQFSDAPGGPWSTTESLGRFVYPGDGAITDYALADTYVESFSTNPAGKYTAVFQSPTVSWDSAGGAIDLPWDASNKFIIFDAAPAQEIPKAGDWAVEIDMRFVADAISRRHIGLFIGTTGGVGYLASVLDNTSAIGVWNGPAQTPLSTTLVSSGSPCVVGGEYTFRIERKSGSIRMLINGVLYLYGNDVFPGVSGMFAGPWCFGATIKVYEIRTQTHGYRSPHFFEQTAPLAQSFASALLPPGGISSHLKPTPFFDAYHGGLGVIYGTVKEKQTPANAPLRRKVWLMDERSGLVVRETWSDAATGVYAFRGVKQGVPYTVLAYDHAHNYRAVIADNLLPEVLP